MECLALDFGGSSVKYAIVDENAMISESGKLPAPLDSITNFVKCIDELFKLYSPRIDGIALSLPGVIDSQRGIHLGSGAYSSILKGISVVDILTSRYGMPCSIENDGRCGALAEFWNGSLRGVQDGAVLILGTAVGGGIITKGGVQRGVNFSAGEFSYMVTESAQSGILAQAWMNIGMAGITYKFCKLKNFDLSIQDAGNVLVKYDALMAKHFPEYQIAPTKQKIDGKQFFKYLEDGDNDARHIYSQFLHSLALLVHNIQLCNAPERIVIGGGLSRVSRLLPDLNAELMSLYSECFVPPAVQANLCVSRYLDECNLLGAAYRLFEILGVNSSVS